MRVTSNLSSYAFASAICAGANLLSWISHAPSSCFHLAIVLCSLYGGQRAGLLSVGLSILSFEYFFLPPHFQFAVEHSSYPRFAAFITTAVCIHLVIAAKQRADRELQKSEDRLRKIVDTIPVMAWTTGPDGTSEFMNRRWLDYTGLSVEEYRREGSVIVFHPEDADLVKNAWIAALATGVGNEIEARMRRVDGQYRWFLIRSCPLCDEQGNVVRWYGTNTDIEDRKAARDSLQKMEKRLARAAQIATLAEVSASIAHEINQPLTAIIANAHMGSESLSGDRACVVEARAHLQEILDCGYHATEVVRRMRTLFKGGSFEKAPLGINEVAKEVISLIRSEAGRRRVDLEVDLEADLPPILGDRVQIQQVLMNLCVNGLDAMDSLVDQRRKLCLRTRLHDRGAIRVEVQDSGIGLREPDKVFEAFFTTKPNGMGMGLPICRSIIESHSGRLWPQNDDSPGTTFCFTLPVPDYRMSEPHNRNGRRPSGEFAAVSQPNSQ
jgi:PAS domain S-box-containing protein